MRGLRLVALLAGAGALLGASSASASRPLSSPVPGPGGGGSASEPQALQLLGAAARAARLRSWSGTQYLVTWRDGDASSAVVDVRHSPGKGLQVTASPTAAGDVSDAATEVQTDVLDERLLGLLADHYVLQVAGRQECVGRVAQVVEALRPGGASVAGRFWLDTATGLVLRREVYGATGGTVRSTAYVALDVAPAPDTRTSSLKPPTAPGSAAFAAADAAELEGLRRDGWTVPDELPGELQVFNIELTDRGAARVLHLAYSDGLSRLSLFAQPGRIGDRHLPGFVHGRMAGADAWVRSASPERVVWSGRGTVWTLLSDAPPEVVRGVIGALPHDKPPDRGIMARLGRGLSGVGSWLNPFA